MTNEYVFKAGGIIINRNEEDDYVVLVYRDNLYDWSFPKGSPYADELIEEAALRKAQEETGLHLEVIRKLPELRYHYTDGKLCVVHFFLMKPHSFDFSPNKDITQARFVRIDDVGSYVRTDYLQDYFDMLLEKDLLF